MKRFPLFLAVVALVIWVYFNNRQEKVEFYSTEDVDKLVKYIERDGDIEPDYVKTKLEELSNDKDFILIAYNLAKADNRVELSDLIYSFLLNETPAWYLRTTYLQNHFHTTSRWNWMFGDSPYLNIHLKIRIKH